MLAHSPPDSIYYSIHLWDYCFCCVKAVQIFAGWPDKRMLLCMCSDSKYKEGLNHEQLQKVDFTLIPSEFVLNKLCSAMPFPQFQLVGFAHIDMIGGIVQCTGSVCVSVRVDE